MLNSTKKNKNKKLANCKPMSPKTLKEKRSFYNQYIV